MPGQTHTPAGSVSEMFPANCSADTTNTHSCLPFVTPWSFLSPVKSHSGPDRKREPANTQLLQSGPDMALSLQHLRHSFETYCKLVRQSSKHTGPPGPRMNYFPILRQHLSRPLTYFGITCVSSRVGDGGRERSRKLARLLRTQRISS